MFACLYGPSPRLGGLADQFSPLVERLAADTVVFSIAGLDALFGDAQHLASEISRRGAAMGVEASLAVASNKATAILAARNRRGVTIIDAGREAQALAEIPIQALPADPELLLTFERWGIRTLSELAGLPEIGITERLGEAGCQLRRLALGQSVDPLHLWPRPTEYMVRQEFDHPVELLEPLLFVISAQLHELTAKLQQNGQAAIRLTITASFERGGEIARYLDLPIAMRDPIALLKQVQLSMEAKPLGAPVIAIQLTVDPVDPRIVQGGLFQPAAPEPEKFQTLLARLRALAGANRVGSPEILNSHRPDAYRLRPCAFEPAEPGGSPSRPLRLALRYFRPPVAARVAMQNGILRRVTSDCVSGAVLHASGPWRTSGDWWAKTSWTRDEWDIVLNDQAAYRIYLTPTRQWFLCGSYD